MSDFHKIPERQLGLDDFAKKSELFSKSYNDLTDKPTLFSGSYNDLTDKPTFTGGDTVPYKELIANFSQLTSNPTMQILYSTFDETLTFSKQQPGVYRITSSLPIFYKISTFVLCALSSAYTTPTQSNGLSFVFDAAGYWIDFAVGRAYNDYSPIDVADTSIINVNLKNFLLV